MTKIYRVKRQVEMKHCPDCGALALFYHLAVEVPVWDADAEACYPVEIENGYELECAACGCIVEGQEPGYVDPDAGIPKHQRRRAQPEPLTDEDRSFITVFQTRTPYQGNGNPYTGGDQVPAQDERAVTAREL